LTTTLEKDGLTKCFEQSIAERDCVGETRRLAGIKLQLLLLLKNDLGKNFQYRANIGELVLVKKPRASRWAIIIDYVKQAPDDRFEDFADAFALKLGHRLVPVNRRLPNGAPIFYLEWRRVGIYLRS
jgi:hypothetical protein